MPSLLDMPASAAAEVAREFWRLMASNDFSSVAAVLAPMFVLEWPQSRERVRGAERFARINREYVTHGLWRFDVVRLFGSETEAVSEVEVSDGTQHARAISFFSVEDGKITRLVEYWPEAYAPLANRAHLVEPME
ncbi:MAG: nuclear transport factor 2 family protein [Caldimonas sp.]